jgi:glycosyl hydrolase group 75 (putative chitosanase)
VKLTIAFLLLVSVSSEAVSQSRDCTRTAGLAVDADGAPDSYRVDGKGLSYTCDGVFAIVGGVAQTQRNNPANWQRLCREYWARATASGNYSNVRIVGFLTDSRGPVVQGAGDPLPNSAYITTTSLTIPNTPERTQRHYVDASQIPYVVLSQAYARAQGMVPGDVVAVYRPRTDRYAFGVYGDCCSLGEASVRLHQDIGNDPISVAADGTRRANRGIDDPVVFVAFRGQHTRPTLDSARWREEIGRVGEAALATWGGVTRLRRCAARR